MEQRKGGPVKHRPEGTVGWSVGYRWMLAVLAVLIILLSSIAIWNAAGLQRAIARRTQVYVSDVAIQLANDIDNRLQKNIGDLEMLEDSLLQIVSDENIQELKAFLDRKAQILGFTSMVIVEGDGSYYTTGELEEDLPEILAIRSALAGEGGVSFLNRQSILYSIPICREDNVVGALAGVRDRENMQELIQPVSFSGQGLTCIIDCNGEVVISPTNLDPFLRLDDLFTEGSGADQAVVDDILRMQKNIAVHQPGVFSFTAVEGTELILSYNPLHSYDWVLLTLVPENLISHETDLYISQTFLILAGLILLFAVALFMLLRTYRRHLTQMRKIAFTDPVTGGMNNAAFQLRCGQLLAGAPAGRYTVVLLNMKNFKLINETYGSAEGDRTLRYIAQVLSRHVGEGELSARADGDNFFLLLQENDPAVIRDRLAAMVAAINGWNGSENTSYRLPFLLGAYLVDDPSLEVTVIQDRAKTACRNRSPGEEEQCVFYDAAVTRRLQQEHALDALFEQSLKNGDFHLYLQPKVSLNGEKAAGAEALVRWQHPQRGTIYPSDFIPLLEKNGKICRLDLFIFEEACKTLRRRMDAGDPPLPISVNLSRRHFQRADCLDPFAALARRYRIPRGLIELELTESIFFDDQSIENMKGQIDRMHELGFLCSLDDFGAGYSSLGLLMEFDVDVIKIDRRFFQNVENPKTRRVIGSIITLAREIGAHTVAEGIETEEQLDFLRKIGCDLVQGYIFSRPLPVDEWEQWMNNRQS